MEKTFKEVLEPKIRAKSVHLKTCTFTKIHFGEKVVAIFCNSCGLLFSEKFRCKGSEMFSSVIALLPPHVNLSIFPMKEGSWWKDTHLFPLAVSILGVEIGEKEPYPYLFLLHPCNRSFQCSLRFAGWPRAICN